MTRMCRGNVIKRRRRRECSYTRQTHKASANATIELIDFLLSSPKQISTKVIMNPTLILLAFAYVWKSVHDKDTTFLPGLQSLGDWEFCSASSQCGNGCCSNIYSDDGALKCTPLTGGFNPDICLAAGSESAPTPPSPTPPTSGGGASGQGLQAHNRRREVWLTHYGYSYVWGGASSR